MNPDIRFLAVMTMQSGVQLLIGVDLDGVVYKYVYELGEWHVFRKKAE